MHIGIDGRAAFWYRGTGIGTYTYQLLNHLNKIDEINNYMLFFPKDYSNSINFKENFKTKVFKCTPKDNFWEKVNIPIILENSNIDLYHVPQNGVGIPLDKKCKFVITLHDVIPYKMPETVSDRYLKIFNEQIPKIIKLCDSIITVSEYSKNDIINAFNFPADKIFVTPLASEEIYKPLDKTISKNIINKKYNIQGDFLLYVGGFSPRKNIIGLINAFYLIKSEYKKPLSLLILGKKGPIYENTYKKRVYELGLENDVIFPGFIPLEDLPYFYNYSKCLVYPSFYEGFGLPPLEAMACGTPVITSNTTSIPEVVGDSALLINPHDTYDMYKSIKKIINNPDLCNTLSIKGLNHSKNFTWNKCALKTLEAYKNVLI